MKPIKNPFAPGAGSRPPELAGRDDIITRADIALQRVVAGRHAKSQILTGLRGTGKTVLLKEIKGIAESNPYLTSLIEAPEGRQLANLIYPEVHQVLRKLSVVENAKAHVHAAMGALRGFASTFKVSVGDITIKVEPDPGTADSGDLELDLRDLFLAVGKAAESAGKAWCLLIDELQYLKKKELAALIVALHKISQESLPVLFFGAGLPHLPAMAAEIKSYAERLFDFPKIGPLDKKSAYQAIRQPIEKEGESISNMALKRLYASTEGYPYFLQEWGYRAWDKATSSPITETDVAGASKSALQNLDEGFFRVRYDRLTCKEQEYVIAMVKLGKAPYRTSDIAASLKVSTYELSPRRESIIKKGVIYSPGHGDVAFTVPMFENFVKRAGIHKQRV